MYICTVGLNVTFWHTAGDHDITSGSTDLSTAGTATHRHHMVSLPLSSPSSSSSSSYRICIAPITEKKNIGKKRT